MADPPLISVVLPVRNAEQTIDESVNSVLAQTCADFELIVVDDGSTDGSEARIRAAAGRDGRIRAMSTTGLGMTAALNAGIAVAKGRYIARQDGDDVSMPARFERQLAFLEGRARVGAVGTGATTINADGKEIGRYPTRHGVDSVRESLRTARATPVHGSMMIRRACLDDVGGYRNAFVAAQDFDLWLRLSERYDIDNVDEPLYRWRLSPNSTYGVRRRSQLLYCGIALAFAAERTRHGGDSYALLEQSAGDLELFAAGYRLRGLLRALWGELLLRGLNDPREPAHHLRLALRHGDVRPRTLLLWAWTSIGLPWIGGKPLRAA